MSKLPKRKKKVLRACPKSKKNFFHETDPSNAKMCCTENEGGAYRELYKYFFTIIIFFSIHWTPTLKKQTLT